MTTTKVRVDNLAPEALTEEVISNLFEECEIEKIETVVNGTAKPHAIVTFKSEDDVSQAIDNVHNELFGRNRVAVTRIGVDGKPQQRESQSQAGPGQRRQQQQQQQQQPPPSSGRPQGMHSMPPASMRQQPPRGPPPRAFPGRGAPSRDAHGPPAHSRDTALDRQQPPPRNAQYPSPGYMPPRPQGEWLHGASTSAADRFGRSPPRSGGAGHPAGRGRSPVRSGDARGAYTGRASGPQGAVRAPPSSSSSSLSAATAGQQRARTVAGGADKRRRWESLPRPSFPPHPQPGTPPPEPYPQFLVENTRGVETVRLEPSARDIPLPDECTQDLESGKFKLCRLAYSAPGKSAPFNADIAGLKRQLHTAATTAHQFGATCAATVVFGTSRYVVPDECIREQIPLADFREMLDARYIRHVFHANVPAKLFDAVRRAVCGVPNLRYEGDAVVVEAAFSDNTTALYAVDNNGDLQPDTAAIDIAAELRTPARFLTAEEAAAKAKAVEVDADRLSSPQTRQLNRRFDVLGASQGWAFRVCTAKLLEGEKKPHRYHQVDLVHRRLGDKQAGIAIGSHPHYTTATTAVLCAGRALDFQLVLSEIPPTAHDTPQEQKQHQHQPSVEEMVKSAVHGISLADSVIGQLPERFAA